MNYFIDAHNEPFHHFDDLEKIRRDLKISELALKKQISSQTNFKDIKESGCKLFFGVLYTDGRFGYKRAFLNINFLFGEFEKNIQNNKFILIKNKEDLNTLFLSDKIGVILEIEGTKAIKSLKDFDYFYNKGLRCLTLTHNYKNYLGCGVKSRENCGISNLYKSIIKNYQNKPLLIDLAHINRKGFYEALKITNLPVIVSHANCYNLCRTKRNLTDDQIKKIAEKKGVIGITFVNSMLVKKTEPSIDDVVNHIEYIVNLVGIDYVGIGSDFGGALNGLPKKLEGINKIKNLENCLRMRGFKNNEIRKIMGENFARVLKNAFK